MKPLHIKLKLLKLEINKFLMYIHIGEETFYFQAREILCYLCCKLSNKKSN